jgi:hypothetical protein
MSQSMKRRIQNACIFVPFLWVCAHADVLPSQQSLNPIDLSPVELESELNPKSGLLAEESTDIIQSTLDLPTSTPLRTSPLARPLLLDDNEASPSEPKVNANYTYSNPKDTGTSHCFTAFSQWRMANWWDTTDWCT